MLGVLTREQLAHAIFPLGDSTKAEVRAEAARRGLAVADKPDSHDICFIADGDTRGFLASGSARPRADRRRVPARSSATTRAPTASPSASARACTSTGPPPTAAPATCCRSSRCPTRSPSGPRSALEVTSITCERPVWNGRPPSRASRSPAGAAPRARRGVRLPRPALRRRAAHHARPPATGVAAGQAAVLYDGDTVIGSATIASGCPDRQGPGPGRRAALRAGARGQSLDGTREALGPFHGGGGGRRRAHVSLPSEVIPRRAVAVCATAGEIETSTVAGARPARVQ